MWFKICSNKKCKEETQAALAVLQQENQAIWKLLCDAREENEKLTRRCVSYMKAFHIQMGIHELMIERKKDENI